MREETEAKRDRLKAFSLKDEATGGRHYTFFRHFSFNSSAESGAFFFW